MSGRCGICGKALADDEEHLCPLGVTGGRTAFHEAATARTNDQIAAQEVRNAAALLELSVIKAVDAGLIVTVDVIEAHSVARRPFPKFTVEVSRPL